MERQIARSFDKVTLKKIGKGALISLTGGAILGLLDYVGTLDISNPILATIAVSITPTIVNTIKEWMKGS